MAHPTIDIEQEPDVDCPQPAYNAVKYCFKSNDVQTVTGTKATFTIELQNNPLVPIMTTHSFMIAGVLFNFGTANTYSTIDTTAAYSPLEMAYNFKAMLEANNFFFQNYTFAIVGDSVVATARNNGIQPDFNFDYANWTVHSNPLITSETNGTADEYLFNYRLVVQIWECNLGIVGEMVSEEAYQVDSNGDFCINIGKKIAPLLSTRFVHDLSTNVAWYADEDIIRSYVVRYGESYSESSSSCETEAKTFATTECVRVYNGAFERDEVNIKNARVCAPEFMTNTPDYTELCQDSIAYLWINVFDVFETPEPIGVKTHPIVDFFYTDGTTDSWISTQFILQPLRNNKIFAVAAGWETWKSFSDSSKKVSYWRIRVVVKDDNTAPATLTYYGSQYFKLSNCCSGVEFVFLNEYGGYDTIAFTQVDDISFSSSNTVFESFLDAEETNSLRGGQDVIDQFSNNVYTVTSKFVNDYKSIAWIKEFLKSPKKYIRASIDGQEKKINKVLVEVDGVQYAKTKDNSLYLRLSYRINEDLNNQRN